MNLEDAEYELALEDRRRYPWKEREAAERSPPRATRYNAEQTRRAAQLELKTDALIRELGGTRLHDEVTFPDAETSRLFEIRWKEMIGL